MNDAVRQAVLDVLYPLNERYGERIAICQVDGCE